MAALCTSQCGRYAEDQGILCVLLSLPHFSNFQMSFTRVFCRQTAWEHASGARRHTGNAREHVYFNTGGPKTHLRFSNS